MKKWDVIIIETLSRIVSVEAESGEEAKEIVDTSGRISCGETLEMEVANAKDAKKAWLEVALDEGIEICEPDNL